MTEALFGDPRHASGRVRDLVARTATAAESPGTVPRFRAAVALGIVGLGAEAREILDPAMTRYPQSTLVHTVLVPATEAAIALGRGRPAEAVTALDAARPTELGTVAGLVPAYLRGEAFLASGDAAAARVEFQKVIEHRGSDPLAPVVVLAHLGLARAWQLAGETANSRAEYDELLRIWKGADPDLPLLQRVRAERAALGASSSPPPR
jgi:tetratricopeptide (TPR) repeat protein